MCPTESPTMCPTESPTESPTTSAPHTPSRGGRALRLVSCAVRDLVPVELHPSPARVGVSDDLVQLPGLRTLPTAQESERVNRPKEPSIIVSSSGMASGGRVVHHLRTLLPDRRNTVVLTGYQAVGTRGRALAEGAHEVKIAGAYVRVRAEVVQDQGFSVHADADELVAWVIGLVQPPEAVFVTHGEPQAAAALADRLRRETGATVVVARLGERVVVP